MGTAANTAQNNANNTQTTANMAHNNAKHAKSTANAVQNTAKTASHSANRAMEKAQAVQKQVKENSNRLDKAHAQTKQVINTLDEAKIMANGQLAKLRRMWANEDARQKYEKRNLLPIQKREQSRCKVENGGVTVFSAVALDEEVDDVTCINKNRDKLVQAFCNFRKRFDVVLQQSGLKDGKYYWQNICCKSND